VKNVAITHTKQHEEKKSQDHLMCWVQLEEKDSRREDRKGEREREREREREGGI